MLDSSIPAVLGRTDITNHSTASSETDVLITGSSSRSEKLAKQQSIGLYEYNVERPHVSLSGLASTVLQRPLGARALSADRPPIRCHESRPNSCIEPSSCLQPVPISDGGERNRSSGRSRRPFFELKRRNSFSSRSFHISESLFPASGRKWALKDRVSGPCKARPDTGF